MTVTWTTTIITRAGALALSLVLALALTLALLQVPVSSAEDVARKWRRRRSNRWGNTMGVGMSQEVQHLGQWHGRGMAQETEQHVRSRILVMAI